MKSLASCFRRISTRNRLSDLLEAMPKDTTQHIERNQKQRLRIKEKSKFYSPGTVSLQILGSGSRGTSASIYLFSEQSRYLFNCGEGTQRLAHEHRTKLTRMEHVFLTRNTWDRFGGVPGLCLTLQEIGVPRLSLHGPPGISATFESARRFVVLRNMAVDTPECLEGTFWEDSVLRVNYVPLYKNNVRPEDTIIEPIEKQENWDEQKPKSNDKPVNALHEETDENLKSALPAKDETDYFGYENRNFNRKKTMNVPTKQQPSNTDKPHVQVNLKDSVMAFICKLRERAGTLDLSKCVDKGVKPGPLLGKLKNGIDVTLTDGTIVKAEDVRGPSYPGAVFIFIDIPDESYLTALTNCEDFKQHQKGAQKEEDVATLVVHFTHPDLMENAAYKQWIDDFSASTKHWFVNERNEFSGFFSAHRIQRQLNKLDTKVFPLLKESHPYLRQDSDSKIRLYAAGNDEMQLAKKMKLDGEEESETNRFFKDYPELGILSAFHLRPPKGFDRSLEPYSNPETATEETETLPEVMEMISEFKKEAAKLIQPRSQEERAKEFPKIVTFGTGSCIPNKTRNVSANLVQFTADNCAILDCGEGTLGQLIRFYGRDGADGVLKKLRMIYVSHLHADHHLGLIDILNRRRKLTDDKVLLLAPFAISRWLAFYNFRIQEIYSSYDLFSCENLLGWNIEDNVKTNLFERLGLVKVDTCHVKHCPHSFGVSFEMKNSMQSERFPGETVKITYSGDTLPCNELVAIGQNSDVLIHEATMEDNLEREAAIKMHSTVSQAIDIGRQMNAKFIILTHFSQRYAKIPLMDKNVENVAIAFDNMEVTLNDLPMMHLMYEPLKAMFSEHFELMEQKALKRKHQQQQKIEINMPNGNQHNKVKKFANSDED